MRRLLGAATLLVLALSACDMRAELSVNDDGSGSFGFVFAADPATLEGIRRDFGEDPFASLRADLADDPVPWRVTDFAEGALRGVRASVPFRSIDHFRELVTLLEAESGDRPSSAFDDRFRIERRDGGWRIRAVADPPTGLSGGLSGEAPPGLNGAALGSLFRMSFRVSLPGRPAAHNANRVIEERGRTTFVWDVSALAAGPTEMRAETRTAGGGLPVFPVAAAVVLAASLVAVAVLLRRPQGPPPATVEELPVPVSEAPVPEREVAG